MHELSSQPRTTSSSSITIVRSTFYNRALSINARYLDGAASMSCDHLPYLGMVSKHVIFFGQDLLGQKAALP
jgi:hypothetical protein